MHARLRERGHLPLGRGFRANRDLERSVGDWRVEQQESGFKRSILQLEPQLVSGQDMDGGWLVREVVRVPDPFVRLDRDDHCALFLLAHCFPPEISRYHTL